jgi:protein-disulfide isomerase
MTSSVTELRFVFRHFPLTTIHPHAELAAEAAEAAGAQRKFWPMIAHLPLPAPALQVSPATGAPPAPHQRAR